MTELGKTEGINLPVYLQCRAAKINHQFVSQFLKQLSILFIVFSSMLSTSSWAVGTVDIAEITPVTATILPNTSQSFSFNAQNTKTEILSSYTIKLAYSDGLDVSNLMVSPPAKSAKIDTRKQLITIQWTKVAVDSIVSATWDASSAVDGSYTFSDAGLVYKIGRVNYTGTVNSATLNVVTDTTAPAIPSGLSATASDVQVSLSWAANNEADLAGYDIYRATTMGGPYTQLTTTSLASASYIDTSVSNGIVYYYVVTASDLIGIPQLTVQK